MVDLGSDPGFQSFLRTLESRRALIESNKNRRIAGLLARRGMDLADIGIEETKGLEGVDDEFEARGMFRAGGRLEDRADVVELANAGRARAELDLAEGSAEANRGAASELAGLSTQRAQAEMDARARIADREFRIAEQARAERLAAQQRADWLEEQKRLQALYDRQAGGGGGGGGGGSYVPATRSYTTAPRQRTSSNVYSRAASAVGGRSNIFTRATRAVSRPKPKPKISRTNPVRSRSGSSIYF